MTIMRVSASMTGLQALVEKMNQPAAPSALDALLAQRLTNGNG